MMRDLLLFVLLLPRNLGILVLRGYRAGISPLYGDVCRYHPSCSAYGLVVVQQRGLLFGAVLAVWRILRCNPWVSGGIDDPTPVRHDRYRVSRFGWVLPAGLAPTIATPLAHCALPAPAAPTAGYPRMAVDTVPIPSR